MGQDTTVVCMGQAWKKAWKCSKSRIDTTCEPKHVSVKVPLSPTRTLRGGYRVVNGWSLGDHWVVTGRHRVVTGWSLDQKLASGNHRAGTTGPWVSAANGLCLSKLHVSLVLR